MPPSHPRPRWLQRSGQCELNRAWLPACGLLAPLTLSPGPKQRKAASLYLGLAQEIHRLQVLHVPPMGPEDLTPGDLPRLQGDLFLEGAGEGSPERREPPGASEQDGPLPNSHGLWEANPPQGTWVPYLQTFLYLI